MHGFQGLTNPFTICRFLPKLRIVEALYPFSGRDFEGCALITKDMSNHLDEEDDSLSYLTSNTMATISSTLALAANVTGFDCTELWTLDSNGAYYCPYVYATPELQRRCPHLLTGHHPRDKIEHLLSPKVTHSYYL